MNRAEHPANERRILIAENQDDARETLKDLLQMSLGLQVDAVADGAAALNRLKETPYSILVTDLRMPKLHGLKLIEAIAADPGKDKVAKFEVNEDEVKPTTSQIREAANFAVKTARINVADTSKAAVKLMSVRLVPRVYRARKSDEDAAE